MNVLRMARPYPLLLTLGVLALQSCARDPVGAEYVGDLGVARLRWEAQGIRDYRYTVANSCFCAPDVIGPVRVEVRDGRTVSVTPVDPALSIRREAFEGLDTVEELFATIRHAIDQGPDALNARYDPERGYPVTVWVDYEGSWADEEKGFQVTDFERIR